MTMLPLPKIDKSRGWGRQCQSCIGSCNGHYICELVDVTDKEAMSSIASPPSTILKEFFSKAHIETEEDGFIEKASQQALLKRDDTKIWLEHIHTILQNRKQGAAQAAATRIARTTSRSVSTPVTARDSFYGNVEKNILRNLN